MRNLIPAWLRTLLGRLFAYHGPQCQDCGKPLGSSEDCARCRERADFQAMAP